MFDAEFATELEMMGKALERASHTSTIHVLHRKEGTYRIFPLGATWPGAELVGKTDSAGLVFTYNPDFIATRSVQHGGLKPLSEPAPAHP